MSNNRQRTLGLLCVLVVMTVLVGACQPVPQPTTASQPTVSTPKSYKGEKFVVYSYGGSWDDAIKEAAVKPLQAAHPDLEVIVAPDGGFTKLLAEKADPQADVSFVDDSAMPQAIAAGLIDELDPTKIASWNDIYDEGKLFGKYGAAMEFGRFGICYRADKIEKPTSWEDLWNPKYKGHVTIGKATIGSTSWVQFLDAAARLNGGTVTTNVQTGFDKMKLLKPNLLTLTTTTGQINQLLTDGDLWITHFWDGRCIYLKRAGVKVEYVDPKEGPYATITYITMVKGAKHPELAYEFIEYVLKAENQGVWTKYIGYGPTNKKTVLDKKYIEEGVLYGEQQVKAMRMLPWQELANKRAPWLETWNTVMEQ